MIMYMIGILGGDALIMIFNLIFSRNHYSISFIVIASFLGMIGVIAIDGILAAFVRRCLPEKWFDCNAKFHKASKKECDLYEKLGVKFWKDHVLELGIFTGFSKKEVQNPNDIKYIERFILENNFGSIGHLLDATLGFLLILFYPGASKYLIAVPVCIINFVLSMLPWMILRYNTNRLLRVHGVLVKKAARNS